MPLLSKREYTKKEPFRDANIYIIVCEGEKREPEYFRFFEGLSSKLKLHIVPSKDGKSAPSHLIDNAIQFEESVIQDEGDYELWFILDRDRWDNLIYIIHEECGRKHNWNIAISNPCFEVWLYYHFSDIQPDVSLKEKCSNWKNVVNRIVKGGFNSDHHPTFIEDAIRNSRINYKEEGYLPNVGSTQMHRIAERIFGITQHIINKYRYIT
jgi:hypothetical protein